MSSLWIVLDTRSPLEARRIGRVKGPDDDISTAREITVEWSDGLVEEVKASSTYRRFRLDTLSTLREFAPDQLSAELESSPLPFARALAERPKMHMTIEVLLTTVCERAGVDRATVDQAWKSQRRAFEALPQVGVEPRKNGVKYQLLAPLPLLDLVVDDGDQAEPVSPQPTANLSDFEDAGGAPPAESLGTPSAVPDVADGAQNPVDDREAEPPSERGIAEALSMQKPPPIDPERLRAWFDTEAPGMAIADGATELERLRTQPDAYAERIVAYSRLVSRILKQRPSPKLAPEALARAFVALNRSSAESDRGRALDALERTVSVLTKPTDFLSKIDLPALQAALAELPFNESGPRFKILVALGRSGGAILDDAGWWRGFGWPDILANSTGQLSTILAGSETLMAMTRKIVDETARDVTTRRGLSTLLGGPRFALEHVSPAQMNEIFERVAQNDDLLARWVAEISDLAARDDLVRRASDAESQARASKNAESQAREDLDALSRQLAEVQSHLAALQDASAGLSTRERRQVLIDAAKVVAQVAATVEGDGRGLDHDALTRKVTTLAERFGLHAHARPGESVAFEPTRHSAPGTRPIEGEIVNVARAGYTWDDGEERVVVLPALVSRVSGSEESA